MANEIKIPCEYWPHPTRDANAYNDTLPLTNNEFVQLGAILPDSLMSRICFRSSEPLPTNYSGTPILRILWKTDQADTTSDIQLGYEIEDSVPDTTVEDYSTWAIDTTSTDKSAGAGKLNTLDVALTALSIAAGSFVFGTISRDAQVTNGADALAGPVQIVAILIVGST